MAKDTIQPCRYTMIPNPCSNMGGSILNTRPGPYKTRTMPLPCNNEETAAKLCSHYKTLQAQEKQSKSYSMGSMGIKKEITSNLGTLAFDIEEGSLKNNPEEVVEEGIHRIITNEKPSIAEHLRSR